MARLLYMLILVASLLYADRSLLEEPRLWIAKDTGSSHTFSEATVSFSGQNARLTFSQPLPASFRMTARMQTLECGQRPWEAAGIAFGLEGARELTLLLNQYAMLNLAEGTSGERTQLLNRKGVAQPTSATRIDFLYRDGRLEILVDERVHEKREDVSLDGRFALLSNNSHAKFWNLEVTDLTKTSRTFAFGAPFTDHMVLQRNRPMKIWGLDAQDTEITLHFAGREYHGVSKNGLWEIEIPAHEAGGPHTLSLNNGNDTIELKDILIGDVWICAGQSNMESKVEQSELGSLALAENPDPNLRLLKIPHYLHRESQSSMPLLSWHLDTPSERARMSAIGYYFGRELRRELDVPIGIVTLAVGGSRAESWLSPKSLQSLAERKGYDYEETYSFFLSEAGIHKNIPHVLYNGMVAPIGGFQNAGFLWYQGESNGHRGWFYYDLLKTLISDWRTLWQSPDAPFCIVQLPGFENEKLRELGPVWAELREAQARVAQEDQHVELVSIIDLGDPEDIHPTPKRPVGQRLANLALAKLYDRPRAHHGPVPVDIKSLSNGTMAVRYNTGGGRLTSSTPNGLQGYELSDGEGSFVTANAVIVSEDTVHVSTQSIEKPKYIRYGWSNSPKLDLYNEPGLPAEPFRSDSRTLLSYGEFW